MQETEIQNLLVIGIDTVAIAKSATRAGYKVYVVDFFGDLDLKRVCVSCKSIVKQKRGKSYGKIESKLKSEAFLKIAKAWLKEHKIDAILLSSGLDDDFEVLNDLNDIAPILGNSPKIIKKVRERHCFFEELKRLGIEHPVTTIVKNAYEARNAAEKMGYPVVFKPVKGFGGANIRTVQDSGEVERVFNQTSNASEYVLVQKFIDGIHASVSFIANGDDVKLLTLNEQLLGLRFLSQEEPFGYCGNIVPLKCSSRVIERCEHIAEKVALRFGLKGLNGIDLVISKDGNLCVVEVNPRFQGTFECIEKVLGINLVESHINACLHGSLPTIKEQASIYCTRLILYAPRRIAVPDLTVFPEIRDIPFPETIIEKGEPLCSIITEGKTRDVSFQKAKKLAKSIYSLLHPA
ncbi:MAG: ATP-grasp domain-containing protein [Candidatus Bathyarchaeota archaeon]|nr:ATP-grasp domain-containing protein [Candidatus Bathyarchaeota archaeon A05DMB-5]MDH7558259.1 ATP-grasp domain-containing protein [Candidatus Bathyarchaeota archaeon]